VPAYPTGGSALIERNLWLLREDYIGGPHATVHLVEKGAATVRLPAGTLRKRLPVAVLMALPSWEKFKDRSRTSPPPATHERVERAISADLNRFWPRPLANSTSAVARRQCFTDWRTTQRPGLSSASGGNMSEVKRIGKLQASFFSCEVGDGRRALYDLAERGAVRCEAS
jgi:hypothetical protein